ncbi:MAG: TylF/MycF/NovP-related O-methyltransferase [Planctomycetia bacterium]|nr:TylF/MycF/NovP-related O-methyltransferase [Planctomycetia bacterium]
MSSLQSVDSRNNLIHLPRIQRFLGGTFLERWGIGLLARCQLYIMGRHKLSDDIRKIHKVRRQRKSLLTGDESFNILSLARGFANREGAFIEIGTYEGCSSRLICEEKGDKKLYVCDTYEGLPSGHANDRSVHRLKQYACSLESVSGYLKEFPNVHFVKGLFPDSAEGIIPEDEKFAFAHIDVDLYEGTLAGIRYLYPRMIPGGVIVSHDFSILAGVRKAVYEFMEEHPEATMIELATTQCMIIHP